MFISKKKLKKLLEQNFNHGIDIGESLGEYKTVDKARVAYEAGKIEWWLEKMRPKTFKEWEAWEAENGPLKD